MSESTCPFCGAPQLAVPNAVGGVDERRIATLGRLALLTAGATLTVAACALEDPGSSVALYGMPCNDDCPPPTVTPGDGGPRNHADAGVARDASSDAEAGAEADAGVDPDGGPS